MIYLRTKDVTLENNDKNDLTRFNGFNIYNHSEHVGIIESVEEFPNQIMAIVTLASDESTVLIPLNEVFIVSIDAPESNVYLELPEGLITSQLN